MAELGLSLLSIKLFSRKSDEYVGFLKSEGQENNGSDGHLSE